MTTNETFWFRDTAHYKTLTQGILNQSNASRLRIWSAAASTGQEAYSISISLQDAMRAGKINRMLQYDIVGTDISPSALSQAKTGKYCGVSAARGLSPEQKRVYFNDSGECIELLPQFRKNISFREFNLMDSFSALGRFDIVFCRNVLIYFTQETKADILQRIANALNPNGYLFLGSTESLNAKNDLFEMQRLEDSLVYRKRS